MKVFVTTIMPYYNKKKYFYSSLKSFVNQKFKNKELIIVYDNHDAKDLIYIKKIIRNFKYIKLLINHKNIGAGASRNKALKIAKGNYIAFLDSDDIWDSRKLKEQINFMKKNNINFSQTSYKIIDHKGKTIGYRKVKSKLSYESILKSCDIGLSTVIIKKSFLKNNKFANLKTKEDYVLWLKLLKTDPIYGINKPLTTWRKLDNSLSASITQKIADAFKVYHVYENFSVFKSALLVLQLSFFYIMKNINK
jgi:teichuronic acid biosynthesis glycosyltransferase TuaG